MNGERKTLTGPDGAPVIGYVEDVREGRPWARHVEELGPGAVDAVMANLSGWAVSAPVEFAGRLVARGARTLRHAHRMRCDLPAVRPAATSGARSTPVAPGDPRPTPAGAAPDGFRFVSWDREPADVFPAWFAAYPPGHPDHRSRDPRKALDEELTPLMRGEVIGPLLPCGVLAVRDAAGDAGDVTGNGEEVVGGVLVTDSNDGPWLTEVFRHPDRSPRGLGSLMLSAVLSRAAADGLTEIGLAVTEGNPARRLYERLGFQVVTTSITVLI
ncbi:GNAT family N-acetyltransferase [Streptosporangium sp. NPDC004379]|uniref:GNAT family N-acetyltransferase n=1 Tax=Streptosporangium sp. NPDC004379 TaxID=3366189 RepID=UPI0036A09D18